MHFTNVQFHLLQGFGHFLHFQFGRSKDDDAFRRLLCKEEEFDKNEWTLYGEPDTTVIVNRPATVELTCATILNRLPQLIDAEAGYISTDKLPYSQYMIKPLHEYVKSL